MDERCTRGDGPLDHRGVDLVAADRERPLDERRPAEASVGRGRRAGGAPHPGRARHELPGCEQRDPQCVERGDLVEQDRGSLDIDLDAGGMLITGEGLEHLGHGLLGGEPCDGGPHRIFEDAEVARIAGEVERERRRVPDIAGGAPPARVVAVGQLDLDGPR